MLRRYVKSKRHTMQVDFDAFMAQLKRDSARRSPRRRNRPSFGCATPRTNNIYERRSRQCKAPTAT